MRKFGKFNKFNTQNNKEFEVKFLDLPTFQQFVFEIHVKYPFIKQHGQNMRRIKK